MSDEPALRLYQPTDIVELPTLVLLPVEQPLQVNDGDTLVFEVYQYMGATSVACAHVKIHEGEQRLREKIGRSILVHRRTTPYGGEAEEIPLRTAEGRLLRTRWYGNRWWFCVPKEKL